jgi:hypothetical protein
LERQLRRGSKIALVIGVGACRGPLDARCRAKSIGYWPIRDAKKVRPKICILSPVSSKLGSRVFVVLLRGKSEGGTKDCHEKKHGTEHGIFRSVIVFIKLAASGDKL